MKIFKIILCALMWNIAAYGEGPIQGRISNDRYYSHGDMFSIALPSKINSAEIEDFYTAPNIGGVAFFNNDGFLLKLEIDQVVPEITSLANRHPEIKHEILDALFYEVLLPQIKIVVPKSHLLHERKLRFNNGDSALFAVLDLPETSTLYDMKTGKNLDSKRGLLLFFTKNNKEIINLSMQDTLTLIPSVAEAAKAKLNDRLLNHLINYQKTLKIENPTL